MTRCRCAQASARRGGHRRERQKLLQAGDPSTSLRRADASRIASRARRARWPPAIRSFPTGATRPRGALALCSCSRSSRARAGCCSPTNGERSRRAPARRWRGVPRTLRPGRRVPGRRGAAGLFRRLRLAPERQAGHRGRSGQPAVRLRRLAAGRVPRFHGHAPHRRQPGAPRLGEPAGDLGSAGSRKRSRPRCCGGSRTLIAWRAAFRRGVELLFAFRRGAVGTAAALARPSALVRGETQDDHRTHHFLATRIDHRDGHADIAGLTPFVLVEPRGWRTSPSALRRYSIVIPRGIQRIVSGIVTSVTMPATSSQRLSIASACTVPRWFSTARRSGSRHDRNRRRQLDEARRDGREVGRLAADRAGEQPASGTSPGELRRQRRSTAGTEVALVIVSRRSAAQVRWLENHRPSVILGVGVVLGDAAL